MTVLAEDVPITELEKIEADRVDGVHTPANGIPFLLMKSVEPEAEVEVETAAKGSRNCPSCSKEFDADHKGNQCPNCGADLPAADTAKSLPAWYAPAVRLVTLARLGKDLDLPPAVLFKAVAADGSVDEQPDIDGGKQAIALIAKLIGYEADELAAGNLGETSDISQLCMAADCLRWWIDGEAAVQQGNVAPAGALMQSAAKGGPSADERRKAAGEGNALPDGSYPIRNAKELNSAAVLARSGHGDVAGAKKLIARRAKELGVANPLDNDDDGDTSKGTVAEEETTVDTGAQTGDLTEIVKAAVTQATAPLQERITALDAELAKVKALPVPGGPMMSVARQPKAGDGENWAAKAAYYREMADSIADPATADSYRTLARQADDKAKQP